MSFPAGPSILVTNAGGGISDPDVLRIVAAIQLQAARDFCPAYGLGIPTLRFGKAADLQPSEWHLVFAKNSDEANALGYHETTQDGSPIAYVFTETTRNAGYLVSVTASHELLEMLKDPQLDQTVPGRYKGKHVEFAVEVADPPEADRFGYPLLGVEVSDFCLPSYFHFSTVGPYSFKHNLKKPCPALLPGGYISYALNGQWHEIEAKGFKGHRGSRHTRRLKPRHLWRKSEPKV